MHEVVYLTGAPGSGKSSLTRALANVIQPLKIFEYGRELTTHVANKTGSDFTQADLRERSAAVATHDDIRAVDVKLRTFVARSRKHSPVIIDSHAVTKERFGFRITTYEINEFKKLNPTQIWVLYSSPQITIDRIRNDPQGRPTISIWESEFHTTMQASVAINYGMHLGVQVLMFDSNRSLENLVSETRQRLQ